MQEGTDRSDPLPPYGWHDAIGNTQFRQKPHKGYSVNRTSRKILVRLAVMTTASSGLFSSGPLKWIPQSHINPVVVWEGEGGRVGGKGMDAAAYPLFGVRRRIHARQDLLEAPATVLVGLCGLWGRDMG